MINYDDLARKIAKDLCRRQALDDEKIVSLVRDAFRRGLQLGLSVRHPESPTRPPDATAAPPSSPLVH